MGEENKFKEKLVKIIAFIFVFCLLIIWCLNLRYVWMADNYTNTPNNEQKYQDLIGIKNGLNDILNKAAEQLKQLEISKNDQKIANENSLAQQLFLANLLKETNKIKSSLATSSLVTSSDPILKNLITTSTVSSSKDVLEGASSTQLKKNNCPAFINCMPTIGSSAPCRIPLGCEKITTIAY